MNYMKPQIAALGAALSNIQGTGKWQAYRDNAVPHPLTATPAAYDADE